MENKSKSYSLVAWTEKGQVRMVPSLVNEQKKPFEKKLELFKTECHYSDAGWLLAYSGAWDEYARFFMNIGYFRQAYRCYENAATVCTYGSTDLLWVDDDNSSQPVLPLFRRFLAMRNHCLRLVGEHPALRHEYESGDLERDYQFFTFDDAVTYGF